MHGEGGTEAPAYPIICMGREAQRQTNSLYILHKGGGDRDIEVHSNYCKGREGQRSTTLLLTTQLAMTATDLLTKSDNTASFSSVSCSSCPHSMHKQHGTYWAGQWQPSTYF